MFDSKSDRIERVVSERRDDAPPAMAPPLALPAPRRDRRHTAEPAAPRRPSINWLRVLGVFFGPVALITAFAGLVIDAASEPDRTLSPHMEPRMIRVEDHLGFGVPPSVTEDGSKIIYIDSTTQFRITQDGRVETVEPERPVDPHVESIVP